jgi:hypothetical protein
MTTPRPKLWLKEHARLSLLINKQIRLPALVLEDEASEPYDLRTVGTGDHDFSVLVDLRRSHQTRHAAEGVRTRDSTETNRPNESVRCKLIREMNALLRQDQVRAPGTGQDRKLRWEAPTQEATGADPGHQQPVPVPTGNSANAATVTASRVRKVFFWLSPFWPLDLQSLGVRLSDEKV